MDATIALDMQKALASLGVADTTLTPAQRQALDDRGYLVLLDAVDSRALDRLRAAFDRACEREGIPPRGTRHPKTLLESDPAFLGLLTHPALLAAVWHVLGRPFFAGGAAGRDPMPGFGAQGLHIDGVDAGPSTPFLGVTALGMLDEFTEDNGATRVLPASHRARRAPPKTLADPASRHPDQVVVTAPAGSILVFNAHLWHSGTPNRSALHRRSVQCTFHGREQLRPGMITTPNLDLAPAVRFLLGLDSA